MDPWKLCWPQTYSVETCAEFAEQVSVNHNRSCCMCANNSLCFSFLFLASSVHLTFACVSGVKPKRDLCTVSHKAGEVACYPALPFLVRGTLWGGKFLLGTEQCWRPGWDVADKLNFLLFLCNYSQIFVVVVVPQCC